MTHARRRLPGRVVGAAAALALAAGLVAVARPGRIVALVASVRPGALLIAAGAYGAVLVVRGVRLRWLLPAARMGTTRAVLIAGAGRSAAIFLPFRTGELVLPWLLRRHAGLDLATGVAGLLAARVLDLAALAVWGSFSVIWVTGARLPALAVAAALLAPLLVLPTVVTSAERLSVKLLGERGEAGRRWIERAARLRASLDTIRGRPVRLVASISASVVIWGLVWGLTWVLLQGMGRDWRLGAVIAGSAASAVANLLPLNLVANVGTLEAGWTAAFTALGIPPAEAAATGFATHALSLLINAGLGGAAWLPLAFLRRPDSR